MARRAARPSKAGSRGGTLSQAGATGRSASPRICDVPGAAPVTRPPHKAGAGGPQAKGPDGMGRGRGARRPWAPGPRAVLK